MFVLKSYVILSLSHNYRYVSVSGYINVIGTLTAKCWNDGGSESSAGTASVTITVKINLQTLTYTASATNVSCSKRFSSYNMTYGKAYFTVSSVTWTAS